MKRLDLIINALDRVDTFDWNQQDNKLIKDARIAARELRELEPVGMRYNYFGWNTRAFDEELFKRLEKYPDSTPQKLYALGGEK